MLWLKQVSERRLYMCIIVKINKLKTCISLSPLLVRIVRIDLVYEHYKVYHDLGTFNYLLDCISNFHYKEIQ